MIQWLHAIFLLMTLLSCLLNATLVFLPVFLVALVVDMYVSVVRLSPGFPFDQVGNAVYLYVGLFPPVSVGAVAHGVMVSALRFAAPKAARALTVASAPVLPFISSTLGWEHVTKDFPIALAIATLTYGLSCAFFGPPVVARLLAAALESRRS